MTKPLALALIGQNANQALATSTLGSFPFFQSHGYDTALIDLHAQDASQQILLQVKTRRPDFVYSMAGVGADLSFKGANLWELWQIPFLSMLFDHPCYIPERHKIPSRYVANCYYAQDFLQVQQDYIQSPQLSCLLPSDFPPLTDRPLPWAERDIGLLFVKSGGDAGAIITGWRNNLPTVLADFLLASAQRLQCDRHLAITDLVQSGLRTMPDLVQQTPNIFWKMVRTLDTYIRRWRAESIVNILKTMPEAVIVGDDWNHIDRSDAVARFMPAMPADQASALFGRAKLIFNTNPYFRYGLHERVGGGLQSGAWVMSDRNDLSDEALGQIGHLIGFEWSDPAEHLRNRARDALVNDPAPHLVHGVSVLDQTFRQRLYPEIAAILAKLKAQ
jgi:hypothetical protein